MTQVLAALCASRGVACQNMDLYDRAIRNFREALALDPWCQQAADALQRGHLLNADEGACQPPTTHPVLPRTAPPSRLPCALF